MAFSYHVPTKATTPTVPQGFAHSGSASSGTAQTPVSAPGSAHSQSAPTASIPLQNSYDASQAQIPPLVPTPLYSLNSLHSSGAQTPQASLGASGPTSYAAEHPPQVPYQPVPAAHASMTVPGGNPANVPNLMAVPAMHGVAAGPVQPDHSVAANSMNNNMNSINSMNSMNSTVGGPGVPGLAPNTSLAAGPIPGLNSVYGNLFRRSIPDPTSDPASFGHYPYAAQSAPVAPHPQMMHAQGFAAQSYPQDPASHHPGFNFQLGPIGPGPTRTGIQGVGNAYYAAAQPSLQPFRYHMEDRYAENAEPYLAPARTKAAGYPDSLPEYGGSSFRIGPPPQHTQTSVVPSFPSLLKQEPPRPSSLGTDTVVSFSPPSSAGGYAKRTSEEKFDGSTHFKPTETKRNKRPKINKLASDSAEYKPATPKKTKVVAEEYSFDESYANFQEILGIPAPRADIRKVYQLVLQSPLERYLFDFFVHKIAIFIDTFLVHEFFQVVVSELALYDETRMILDSMLCLSSLISQRMDPSSVDALCPYDYYHKCVLSVGKNVALDRAQDPDGKILARCLISTNLLCIYEMFFVAVDSVYVKGAGGILATIMSRSEKSVGILRSSPFHYSCFWATVVCDLILSLKLECPSTFSIEKVWRSLDPTYDEYDSYEAFLHEKTTIKDAVDDYSSFVVTNEKTTWWLHKVTLLFILVNDFYNQNDVITHDDFMANRRYYRWLQLKEKMEEYEKRMPIFMKPLIFMPAAEEKDFPRIFFKDEKTAVTAINFRLAKLLLHAALKDKLQVFDGSLIAKERQSYPRDFSENLAREVAGIMQTYDSDMKIWPINIHSLRQASRYIDPSSPCFETLKNLTARVISVCQTRSNILALLQDKEEETKTGSVRSLEA